MSRTYKIASTALAGALILTAFGAHAQNWNGGSMFGRYDGDKDGKISPSEYEAGRQNAFSRVDADGNGALSFAEIDAAIAMAAQRGGAMAMVMQSRLTALKAADADGDSVISADEYKTAADAEFKTLDTDGMALSLRPNFRPPCRATDSKSPLRLDALGFQPSLARHLPHNDVAARCATGEDQELRQSWETNLDPPLRSGGGVSARCAAPVSLTEGAFSRHPPSENAYVSAS